MITYPNIFRETIEVPYGHGHRQLSVVTAYASPSFVHHVLYQFEQIHIRLIIGMTRVAPIPIWEHNQYVEMANDTSRLQVWYFTGDVPIHAKMLLWDHESNQSLGFAGSANFSWNGFHRLGEVMLETRCSELMEFSIEDNDLVECTDPLALRTVPMTWREQESPQINTDSVGDLLEGCPYVELSFLSADKVPERSGLNWGQREGREPNQAYIPIPRRIHNAMPGFFPSRGRRFTVVADDGQSFICVIAQDNDKALETCNDNSILGRYFRHRLDLPLGSEVLRQDLERYGRTDVRMYKIDSDTYFMDFSRPQ